MHKIKCCHLINFSAETVENDAVLDLLQQLDPGETMTELAKLSDEKDLVKHLQEMVENQTSEEHLEGFLSISVKLKIQFLEKHWKWYAILTRLTFTANEIAVLLDFWSQQTMQTVHSNQSPFNLMLILAFKV